jgi:hypothetical protein
MQVGAGVADGFPMVCGGPGREFRNQNGSACLSQDLVDFGPLGGVEGSRSVVRDFGDAVRGRDLGSGYLPEAAVEVCATEAALVGPPGA